VRAAGTRSSTTAIAERLADRRREMEEAVLARAYAVSDPARAGDPEYVNGFRSAIGAAIEYVVVSLRGGDVPPPPVPAALLSQARLAGRNKVPLDTVIRRYFAGFALLAEFMIDELARDGDFGLRDLKPVLQNQAPFFERLLAGISEEHRCGYASRSTSGDERRTHLVERMLEGELLDGTALGYELDDVHIGVIAKGAGAQEALRAVARDLDRRLLAVPRPDDTVWAWFGGRSAPDPQRASTALRTLLPPGVVAASGEPGKGRTGWRLSHQQARACLPIAMRRNTRLISYGDVPLLATMLHDKLLSASMRQIYLQPLERERDGGRLLRRTVRAYIDAGRNVSSAAAALRVNRKTVASRLTRVEALLERDLGSCLTELDAALEMEELEAAAERYGGPG
jgi:PucR C-terminal helix-turn-helix domain/GGDEF-like domain